METLKNIETRRSIRAFSDKPVGKNEIEGMVRAAALAPSWKNSQTARFTAVTDKELLSSICDTLIDWNKKIVSGASLLIAVSAVTGRAGFNKDGSPASVYGEGYTFFDCGAAVENLCLAANDMGIGTVILGIFDPDKIRALLEIPEGEAPVVLIACGYKAETPLEPKRRPIEEILRVI